MIGSLIVITPVASAAGLTSISDLMDRQKVGQVSDHTFAFTTPTGVAATETITFTFPAGFDLSSIVFSDIDLSTTTGGDLTLAVTATTTTWGAVVAGQVLTLTSATGTIAAADVITVEIGTVATFGVAGANQIVNHATASASSTDYTVAIGGTMADSGSVVIPVNNDDQIHVSAEVSSELTFTLHDALDDASSSLFTDHSNAIDFGTLSSSAARFAVEGGTSGGGASAPTGGAHGIKVGTNANSGYSITTTGTTLTNGSNTITAIGAGPTASSVGSEQFGICLTLDTTGTSGVDATDVTQNGAIGASFDCGSGYGFVAGSANTVATGNAAGPTSVTFYDVGYLANISSLTESGAYATDLTWIATATF